MSTITPRPVDVTSDPRLQARLEPGEIGEGGATAAPDSVNTPPATMPPSIALTPQSLMAYCSARLNSLDSQMNGIFTTEQQNEKLTTDVNNIASAINDIPAPSSSNASTTPLGDQSIAVTMAYQTAIADAKACDNSQLANSLQNDLNTWDQATGGNWNTTISSATLSQLSQNLKNDASDLNSNSELTMINLQSLMSQRQTAVQLTTNLVQSLGDQSNSIAKNIGS